MKNDKFCVSKKTGLLFLIFFLILSVYLFQLFIQSNKVVINNKAAERILDTDYRSYSYCLSSKTGTKNNTLDIYISSDLKKRLNTTRMLKIFTAMDINGLNYTYLGMIDPKKITSNNKIITVNVSNYKKGTYTFYAWQFSPLIEPTSSSQKQAIPTPTHPPKEIKEMLLQCMKANINPKKD